MHPFNNKLLLIIRLLLFLKMQATYMKEEPTFQRLRLFKELKQLKLTYLWS